MARTKIKQLAQQKRKKKEAQQDRALKNKKKQNQQQQQNQPLKNGERVRKKYRKRPGTAAVQEIRRLRKCDKKLIPRLPFQRLVKEISRKNDKSSRMKAEALEAIQWSAEQFITQYMKEAHRLNTFAKQKGLTSLAMQCVMRLKDPTWVKSAEQIRKEITKKN